MKRRKMITQLKVVFGYTDKVDIMDIMVKQQHFEAAAI